MKEASAEKMMVLWRRPKDFSTHELENSLKYFSVTLNINDYEKYYLTLKNSDIWLH